MSARQTPPDTSSRLKHCLAELERTGHDEVEVEGNVLMVDIRRAMEEAAHEESEAIAQILDQVCGKDVVVGVRWQIDSDAGEYHAVITLADEEEE